MLTYNYIRLELFQIPGVYAFFNRLKCQGKGFWSPVPNITLILGETTNYSFTMTLNINFSYL